MGKVVFDISMSLDGFIAGPNNSPDVPLGVGGLRLHDWLGPERTPIETKLFEDAASTLGAVICGRRTYDNSAQSWGPNHGPGGTTPVFVVTHRTHETPIGPLYTFVGNIEAALQPAKDVAGNKDICIMGGANLAQQYLKAGLLDEVSIHLIPTLLSAGTRLFDNLSPTELDPIEVVASSTTTHLRYRVVR